MSGNEFNLEEASAVLARTPGLLDAWLRDLPSEWTTCDEGPSTFSPFVVVGHLVHGERTDWIPRLALILQHGEERAFDPFDRFAQLETSKGKCLKQHLDEFALLRRESLAKLNSFELDSTKLDMRGRHPEFGLVTARQLLSTWVVHDLGHVAQIARVMAKRYSTDVGPWSVYLPVLTRK